MMGAAIAAFFAFIAYERWVVRRGPTPLIALLANAAGVLVHRRRARSGHGFPRPSGLGSRRRNWRHCCRPELIRTLRLRVWTAISSQRRHPCAEPCASHEPPQWRGSAIPAGPECGLPCTLRPPVSRKLCRPSWTPTSRPLSGGYR